jgi:hypothetical protein
MCIRNRLSLLAFCCAGEESSGMNHAALIYYADIFSLT